MRRALKVAAAVTLAVLAAAAALIAFDGAMGWYIERHPTYPDAMRD